MAVAQSPVFQPRASPGFIGSIDQLRNSSGAAKRNQVACEGLLFAERGERGR